MKTKIFIILLGVLLFAGLASSPVMALELKFGHYAAETHPGHKATLMFAEAVEKRLSKTSSAPST
jgi:TRAP-type C4-dicarboxylate transport system substrate-binding protein